MELIRDRFPILSASPTEGVVKGYNHSLKGNPMFVSKVIEGGLQSSQLY